MGIQGSSRLSGALVAALLLAAAPRLSERTALAAEPGAGESAMRDLLAEQTAAWNRGDAEAWTSGFAADELRTRLKYVLERGPAGWTIVSAQNTAIQPVPR